MTFSGKYFLPFFLLFFFISCEEQKIDYETAIENCHKRDSVISDSLERSGSIPFFIPNPKCLIGSQLPGFEAHSLNGAVVNSESLMGKMNFINFWFITCPPCVEEMPDLNYLVDKYADRNINFIAVGRDYKKDIEEFLETHEFKFDIIPDGKPLIEDVFKFRWGYPKTFVTDADGKIIKIYRTITKGIIEKEIEPLISEHTDST